MKKSVDQYILNQSSWYKELSRLRDILNTLELEEDVKWGMPVYTVGGKNVVGIGAFKSHFGLWFYQGALLRDSKKKLINAQEGKTKAMRQLRFSTIEDINDDLIIKYVNEAIANQKKGLTVKPSPPIKQDVPDLLKKLLEEDTSFFKNFNNLTPYKQREYSEYISEAKKESTRLSRIEKIKPMINSGIGLNDNYRNK